jgi:hypothetical protein
MEEWDLVQHPRHGIVVEGEGPGGSPEKHAEDPQVSEKVAQEVDDNNDIIAESEKHEETAQQPEKTPQQEAPKGDTPAPAAAPGPVHSRLLGDW